MEMMDRRRRGVRAIALGLVVASAVTNGDEPTC